MLLGNVRTLMGAIEKWRIRSHVGLRLLVTAQALKHTQCVNHMHKEHLGNINIKISIL